ncbi:MAG: hypothetical protein V5A84_04260, partial [Planctomycetota bacterium]
EYGKLLKLEPCAVTKPWGLVHEQVRQVTGVELGVGEFWLASAQVGEGNFSNPFANDDTADLAGLLEQTEAEGEDAMERLLGKQALSTLRSIPHRGKTEAWYVRETQGRAGFVCGPRTEEQKAQLKQMVENQQIPPRLGDWNEETLELMGVLEPLEAGECYLVPCGTLHTMFALGDEGRLVIDELQEGYGESRLPTLTKTLMVQDDILSLQVHPCDGTVARMASGELSIEQDLQLDPTVRVYDFGRGRNERPDLGFQFTDPDAGVRRCSPVTTELQDGGTLTVLVVEKHLAKCRLDMPAGATCRPTPATGSYRIVNCLSGEVALSGPENELTLARGETVLVPGCAEKEVTIEARRDSSVLDDCVPDEDVFRDFLSSRGVSDGDIETLFTPPRAV